MHKRRSSVLFVFAAVAAMVGATLAAPPASADVTVLYDVTTTVSVPATTNGAFTATGTITNSGSFSQPAGSKVAFTITGGTVTSAAGCTISAGGAVCTVAGLNPGQSIPVPVTVTPNAGSTSVATKVDVTAAVLDVNVLDPTTNTATGLTSLAYGVDGSLTNNPSTVLTGDDTLLSATVTNTQAPQAVAAVIASGGTIDSRIALPAGCSITNAAKNVSCSFAMGAGESKSFDVAVATPTNASSMTSTLTITGASGGSKTASVSTAEYANAQAFVPNGDSLSYTGANQFTTFNVPTGSTLGGGTFLLLQDKDITGTLCDGKPCISKAAEAIFPGSGKYSGQDVNNPFVWTIKYNERQVCNGQGGGSQCLIDVYWIGTNETQTRRMLACPSSPTPRLNNIDEPCLVKVDKTQKGYAIYTVAVLRDIVIPILSGVSK